jgi:hypothetical protein
MLSMLPIYKTTKFNYWVRLYVRLHILLVNKGDVIALAIIWDQLIAEMVLLAGIIYFSIYLEQLIYRKSEKKEQKETKTNIVKFIENDLQQRLHFIEESLQYKDYKPFFTDMWDAVILAGKHALLSFELFQSLQRTYSWMKYYNSELEGNKKLDEKILNELLEDVRKSIDRSLFKLKESKFGDKSENHETVQNTLQTNSFKKYLGFWL